MRLEGWAAALVLPALRDGPSGILRLRKLEVDRAKGHAMHRGIVSFVGQCGQGAVARLALELGLGVASCEQNYVNQRRADWKAPERVPSAATEHDPRAAVHVEGAHAVWWRQGHAVAGSLGGATTMTLATPPGKKACVTARWRSIWLHSTGSL